MNTMLVRVAMSWVVIGVALLVALGWLVLALIGTERGDQEWRVRQAEADEHEARLEATFQTVDAAKAWCEQKALEIGEELA